MTMSPTLQANRPQTAHRVMQVAVIGTGSAGLRHLGVLQQMSDVASIAVPVRDSRVAQLREEGRLAVPTVREAVACGARAGIVATDTGRHVEDGLEAMGSGLDVLMEKPLATNAEEANRLRLTALETKRKLFVGCPLRFSESLQVLREALCELGVVHAVHIACQSYLPDWRPQRSYRTSYAARRGEGGVLLDLIHEIDYATWLFGWPCSLQARLKNFGRLGIVEDELADLWWETPTGTLVSLRLDYVTRPSRRRMTACGEAGTLEWDGIGGTVTVAKAGEVSRMLSSSQSRDEMFQAQDRAFLDACWNEGARDARLVSADEGVRALAICDATRRASASGGSVMVDYPTDLR